MSNRGIKDNMASEGYSQRVGAPSVSMGEDRILRDLAVLLANQGITTQAQWEAFINGLTAGQLLTVMKAILKRWVAIT